MSESTARSLVTTGGCRDVLRIALPLILSTGAETIQMFIDRVFLMWYSGATMSAAMFAGMASFTILSLFLGTATYVNTFVAQYDGAGRTERVGEALWQGIYFSIAAGLIIAGVGIFSEQIVNLVGHDLSLRGYEATYFRILCFGSMPLLIASVLSCFFTGRGKTWTVMLVTAGATLVNIVLDYCLIFGHFNMPRWGIAGAAWATVASNVFAMLAYLLLFLRKGHRQKYNTAGGWRFDKELFLRLMKYGLPSGVQFMLNILGFAIFIALVGRISPVYLTATSMAFQINLLAFMPMVGFSMAVSTLVGQTLGRNRPDLAQKSTWSAAYLTITYMSLIAAGYVLVPELFMYPFSAQANPAEYTAIRPIVIKLLCLVAAYSLFDTGNLIFSAALKGAGDTRFVMVVSLVLNWVIMVIPSYLAVRLAKGFDSLYWAWTALTAYVCVLAVLFLLRFLAGKWKSMRVIEAVPVAISHGTPGIPTIETKS